jgi:hypothetical protein
MPINGLSSKIPVTATLQYQEFKSGNAQSRGAYGVDSSDLGRMAAESYTTKAEGEKYRY